MADQFGFEQAAQAQSQAISTMEAGAGLEQMLREALTERFKESPLFAEREKAAQQFLTSDPRIRAEMAETVRGGVAGEPGGAILSPTQQYQIMAQRRAADVVPLMTLNELLGMQRGTYEQAVSGGLRAFESVSGAQQARANLQAQMAQQGFDRWIQQQQLALQQQKAAMPTKRAQDLESGLRSFQEARGEIEVARQLLRTAISSGKSITGAGAGLLRGLRKGLGRISPESTQLETRLANINEKLFETAGKALTATEVEVLAGKIPKMGYDENVMLTILDEMEQGLIRKQQNIILEMAGQ